MTVPAPDQKSESPPPLDLRLLLPALAAWAAVALALSWPVETVAAAAAAALLVGVASVLLPRRWPLARAPGSTAAALILLTVGLCLGASAAQASVRDAGLVPALAAERAAASIEAVVSTDPRVLTTNAGGRSTQLVLVRVQVASVTGRGRRSLAHTPVLVFADLSWSRVRWGETVRARGRFDSAAPGDDVVAVFNASPSPVHLSGPGILADVAEHVRAGLRTAVASMPADARGLVPGLVIGDTSSTPDSLTQAMRATGMTHLSAVSGSNVSFVLLAAMALCRIVRVPRHWRPVAAALCLGGFVVLARPEPSVLRAAVMGLIGLVGLSASRRRAGIPTLSAAVVVLLCLDPWLARSFGFALSTLATLGLLLFATSWGERISAVLPRRLSLLGPALSIPLAAQVMCAPVIVLLQSSVSLVGVLANVLAAPLVAPATVVGVAVALLAVLSPTLAGWLSWGAGIPALGIAAIARACAEVPMGSVPWPPGGAGAMLLAVLSAGMLWCGPWLLDRLRRRPYAVAALALLAGAAAWPTRSYAWPPPAWSVVACDVGQGDGLVLASAPGHAVVVDAGPDPPAIKGCLDRLAVHVVDALVLTHYHADHVEGLPGVLAGRRVVQILTSPLRDPPWQTGEVSRWAATAHVPVQPLYAGDRLQWGQISARVLWPARIIHEGSMPNNASVVMAVDIAGLRVLMLGDVETEAAHQVLGALRRDPSYGRFEVLKVAHHGSAKQDPALVAWVGAPVALVSVGQGNSYGHPAQTTLRLLAGAGSTVYRTDQRGDVAVSRGPGGAPLVAVRGP